MPGKKLADLLPKHKMIIDITNSRMAHPIYSLKDIAEVQVTHYKPEKFRGRSFITFFNFYRLRSKVLHAHL